MDVDKFYEANKASLIRGATYLSSLDSLVPYGNVSDNTFYEVLQGMCVDPVSLKDVGERLGYASFLSKGK